MNLYPHLCIIPARSGSKGLKDKNILKWKGKPLLMHTYDYLIKEGIPNNQIIVSTESVDYLSLMREWGIPESSLLLRPECLAEDYVVDYPVVTHAWSYKEQKDNILYKYISLLRPTSPIRPKGLIIQAINLLDQDPTLTSVRAMRKSSEHPNRIWIKSSQNSVIPLLQNVQEPGNIPRQLHTGEYFYQSGELEVVRRTTLQLGSISGPNVGALVIDSLNPDIDTLDDF